MASKILSLYHGASIMYFAILMKTKVFEKGKFVNCNRTVVWITRSQEIRILTTNNWNLQFHLLFMTDLFDFRLWSWSLFIKYNKDKLGQHTNTVYTVILIFFNECLHALEQENVLLNNWRKLLFVVHLSIDNCFVDDLGSKLVLTLETAGVLSRWSGV